MRRAKGSRRRRSTIRPLKFSRSAGQAASPRPFAPISASPLLPAAGGGRGANGPGLRWAQAIGGGRAPRAAPRQRARARALAGHGARRAAAAAARPQRVGGDDDRVAQQRADEIAVLVAPDRDAERVVQ
eukprot:gene16103-biopygen8842